MGSSRAHRRGAPHDVGRLAREVAEIALDAPSRLVFRRNALERVCAVIGMDAAVVNHCAVRGAIYLDTWGVDADRLRRFGVDYMNEFSEAEYSRTIQAKATVPDERIVTPARRASLRVYSEFLRPNNLGPYCVRMWVNGHGGFWLVFAREGRNARYADRDLAALDFVIPALAIGEAFHAQSSVASHGTDTAAFLRDHGAGEAEAKVGALAERGLTNGEIAKILGRSSHTVRNQLAVVFRKMHVSTRAELAFVLAHRTSLDDGHSTPGSLLRAVRAHLTRSARSGPPSGTRTR
jgi:DNA-binding CsgD family transcriptional regulator